jgi:hypothetical protein
VKAPPDPVRHQDDADLPEAWRRSLAAARAERPDGQRLTHLRSAVLGAAATLGVAGTAAASTTASVAALGVKAKVVLGALLVGGAALGTQALLSDGEAEPAGERIGMAAPEQPRTARAPQPPPVEVAPPALEVDGPEPGEAAAPDDAPPVDEPSFEASPSLSAPLRGSARTVPRPTSDEPSRAPTAPEAGQGEPGAAPSEMQLIRRAHLLTKSDPRAALRILAEHAARFPEGAFAQEREVLAIDALLHAGRKDEAQARGRRFMQDHPGSPHVPRLRALLTRGAETPGEKGAGQP